MDCCFEEEGSRLSLFEDDLDIVGEGEIDDGEKDEHVGSLLPSILVEPIVEYFGFSRLDLMNLDVVLFNESGVHVVEGICCNSHLHDCVDQNLVGNEGCLSSLILSLILRCIPLKHFFTLGGHYGMSYLKELASIIMSNTTCKSKRNSRPTYNLAKASRSVIHWHMFLALRMSVNIKNCLQKSPLEKWP